jgi:two-component sensor histidine kinase
MGERHALPEQTQREERLRFTARELSHRSKNLLAMVQAIARQIGSRSACMNDFQMQFSQRLQGLSHSLDLLVEEDGLGAWIADVVRSQLGPFGEVDGVRIVATGPAVFLRPEAAQNIGLALHELGTNATKHGALSVPEGVITVHWELGRVGVGRTCFRLMWREINGPKVTPPTRHGFGHVVLQRTTGQALQGKVHHEFKADGVTWTLEVPAERTVMPGPPERVREVSQVH